MCTSDITKREFDTLVVLATTTGTLASLASLITVIIFISFRNRLRLRANGLLRTIIYISVLDVLWTAGWALGSILPYEKPSVGRSAAWSIFSPLELFVVFCSASYIHRYAKIMHLRLTARNFTWEQSEWRWHVATAVISALQAVLLIEVAEKNCAGLSRQPCAFLYIAFWIPFYYHLWQTIALHHKTSRAVAVQLDSLLQNDSQQSRTSDIGRSSATRVLRVYPFVYAICWSPLIVAQGAFVLGCSSPFPMLILRNLIEPMQGGCDFAVMAMNESVRSAMRERFGKRQSRRVESVITPEGVSLSTMSDGVWSGRHASEVDDLYRSSSADFSGSVFDPASNRG